MNEKPVINVPIRENRDEIVAISKAATKRLEQENGMVSSSHAVVVTIAYRAIEAFIRHVSENKSETEVSKINFFDLFEFSITYEPSEDGEKDGNYTPAIKIYPSVMNNITKGIFLDRGLGDSSDETITIEPTENLKEIEKIRNDVFDILQHSNFIMTGNGAVATTFAVVMIEELWNWIIKNHVAGNDLSINFCQLFEIGLSYENDVLKPFIAPGQLMKLMAKGDDSTEGD